MVGKVISAREGSRYLGRYLLIGEVATSKEVINKKAMYSWLGRGSQLGKVPNTRKG